MAEIQNWLIKPPLWHEDHLKLLVLSCKNPGKSTCADKVVEKSENFPVKFPIETVRTKTLLASVDKHILDRNAQSAYPVIHEYALNLAANFILFKSEHGSPIEQDFYKNMTLLQFIQRLLDKRTVMFICKNDQYILRDGFLGFGNWETIGTYSEEPPLVLQDYLSYEEIKISAFLSVSSYTYFINDGSRYNDGIPSDSREDIEEEGIIIGLIGTRLEKRGIMEFQEILVTQSQNTVLNGYGNCGAPTIRDIFANFYEEKTFLYNNIRCGSIEDVSRFKELFSGEFFDNVLYAKRLAVSFDTLLIEANARAKKLGKFAYIHVVGIGLGVWRMSIHQEDVFVETFGNRIRALASNLNHISDIHFAYFPRTLNCVGIKDGELFPIKSHQNGGIKIYISEREPYTKLQNSERFLVVSYAWDGNALPGNEFWRGLLENSGDSSTASSCQVAELHNPFINDVVCAENLMVATSEGLISVQNYLTEVTTFIHDKETDDNHQ